MAKKEQKRTTCIFCEANVDSKEHIWAEWLKAIIPRTFAGTRHNVTTVVKGEIEKRFGKVNRPGDPHSQRLRIVCSGCNNGWMSDLQKRSKETITKLATGKPVTFSPETRKTLSAWAAMFTYVWEQAEPALMTSTVEERSAFRATGEPPSGWQVWLGTYNGERWRGRTWRRAGIVHLPDGSTSVLQTTTFAVGKIMFHTSTIPVPYDSVALAKEFHLYRMWPSPGVLMNLALGLSDEDMETLPRVATRPGLYFSAAGGGDVDLLNIYTE